LNTAPGHSRAALLALLFNATIWGLSWWPLRHLSERGLHGLWATAIVFLIGSIGIALIRRSAIGELIKDRRLWVLALAAGLTNACFNWGMTVGEVLRVILLFYLMPVWTMLLARWLLAEPITPGAALRALLAIAGAATVLWQPGAGLPWPASLGDWLGVAGGAAFAWLNVQLRGLGEAPATARALAMSVGSALVPAVVGAALMTAGAIGAPPLASLDWLPGAALLAIVLLVANAALQYGAPRLPTRVTAIVMLTEVPVAALSSALIAGEALKTQVIAGGALIVLSSLAATLSLRRGAGASKS